MTEEVQGNEYPKAIYRDGGDELIWGEPVETGEVHGSEEETAKLKEGWRLHPIADPLDHDGDGQKGGSLPGRRGRKPKEATDA